MMRPFDVRSISLVFSLLLALLVTACSSGGENSRATNTNANSTVNAPATGGSTPPAATNNQAAGTGAAKAKLNLNTASGDEFLAAIPGFGKRMVHEFEEYRPYKSIQQFRREMGKYVGADQIAEYQKYVFVPISPNDADAETLQQIPGLDATEAQSLIAARPFASNDAFLAKLAGSVSAAELAVAKTYLSN